MQLNALLNRRFAGLTASSNVCLLWLLGLLNGRFVGDYIHSSVPPSFTVDSMGIRGLVCLLFWQLLPALINKCTEKKKYRWFLFIVIFLRATGCGVSSYLVSIYYGSAGWLVYRILFFSNSLISALFLWFWIKLAYLDKPLSKLNYKIMLVGFLFYFQILHFILDYS